MQKDGSLDSMQHQGTEGILQNQSDCSSHVSFALNSIVYKIPQIGILGYSAHQIGECNLPDQLSICLEDAEHVGPVML
ncbi:hypothetical protein D3C76_1363030 [compost metagenome]